MRYESKKTQRGNVGVSYESQEAADNQSWQMDANRCTNCHNCRNCTDCTDCTDCHNCTNCHNCHKCTDCTDCSRCSYCSDCTDCHNCTNCHNCHKCTDCTDCYRCSYCSGVLRWSGSAAPSLLALNGLTWPVATDGNSIQIGCQHHSVEAWRGFSDAEISRMEERALEFWKAHKDQILLLVEMRRSMEV